MEYELYYYCTGMGVLIIFLIILYHFMDMHTHKESSEKL